MMERGGNGAGSCENVPPSRREMTNSVTLAWGMVSFGGEMSGRASFRGELIRLS